MKVIPNKEVKQQEKSRKYQRGTFQRLKDSVRNQDYFGQGYHMRLDRGFI